MAGKMNHAKIFVSAGCWTLGVVMLVSGAAGAAENYAIVTKLDATPSEAFAAEELQTHLRLALGRDVPIVTNATAAAVFELGTDRAKDVIGADRIAALQDEESVYVVKDGVVAIAGGGAAGLCYGVYTYLERELGARWFDQESDPVIRKVEKLDFRPREYREKPRLDYRMILCAGENRHPDSRDRLFFFRNRSNQIDNNYLNCARRDMNGRLPVRMIEVSPGCHSLFLYVPPQPKAKRTGTEGYRSDRDEGYFADHPEWYTLNRDGKRVETMQLCLTNPELRRKLTENILDRIGRKGGKGFFDCSAQDVPGELCYCTNCLALSKKYKSKGAPLFDYLHELAPLVKAKHPEATIHFLVYRKEQTQRPPVGMPPWPDNLAAVFAPIDNDFAQDYAHPNNLDSLEDLRNWCRLVRVWTWYYPFTYGGTALPRAGLRRTAVDMRLAIEAGLDGGYVEHDVGTVEGLTFADAQTWMLLQHMRNPDTDWKTLRREFFEFSYGAAADAMAAYSDFIEDKLTGQTNRLTWDGGLPWRPTDEELRRYTELFDEAERLVADDADRLQRVREVRLCWDVLCLVKTCPDLDAVEARITDTLTKALKRRYDMPGDQRPAQRRGLLKTVKTRKFLASVTVKPLPATFDGISEDLIFQSYPTGCLKNYTEYVKDDAAATGYAVREPLKAGKTLPRPYPCGFYDAAGKKFILNTKIEEKDFGSGEYRFHKLGTVPMPSNNCSVWFGTSWAMSLKADMCYRPGSADTFDVWASLKFEPDGTVACDRVVFVRK